MLSLSDVFACRSSLSFCESLLGGFSTVEKLFVGTVHIEKQLHGEELAGSLAGSPASAPLSMCCWTLLAVSRHFLVEMICDGIVHSVSPQNVPHGNRCFCYDICDMI